MLVTPRGRRTAGQTPPAHCTGERNLRQYDYMPIVGLQQVGDNRDVGRETAPFGRPDDDR